MSKLRTAAIAGAVVLLAAGTALAQDVDARNRNRVIDVPPGAVVLVLPAGAIPVMSIAGASPAYAALPISGLPDPGTMFREMHAMMAAAQQTFDAPVWGAPGHAFPVALLSGPGVSSVFVSSVVNGNQSCTRQVVYDGTGKPQVKVFGNACGSAASSNRPAALPNFEQQRPAPHTIEARRSAPTPEAPPARLIRADNHTPTQPLEVAALH